MRPIIRLLLVWVTCIATLHMASAAESVYPDPQGSFILRVPGHWTAALTTGGDSLKSGKA